MSVTKGRDFFAKAVAIVFAAAAFAAFADAATADVGFRDQSFSGTGTAVTGAKPESKLWWNDGFWWASMWDTAEGDNFIFKLEPVTQTWTNTGVRLDNRSGTRADTLWDGTKLYVASHAFTNSPVASTAGARLYRYSYDASTDTYSLDAGFPAAINGWKTETLVLAKDSTGKLWATWTAENKVYVNRTLGDDKTWGTPFALPVADASDLLTDDISSIIAFGGDRVGIMWSNQSKWLMGFAVHSDGAEDTSWTREVALDGLYNADDHINLKADRGGRVFAAVKTEQTDSAAPLNLLLVRQPAGDWDPYTFGLKTDHHTRPIVLLDEENGLVHMFATSGEAGGTVYRKTSPMNAISFAPGVGDPFIRDASSADVNDATSTKQSVDASSGLVVQASNDSTKYYWHNSETIMASGPTADFTASPTSGTAPLTVNFTDASSGSPTSWAWDFQNDGIVDSTAQNPEFTYVAPGTYSVKLTVSDAGGKSSSTTRADYITVGTVVADFTGTPTSGNAPLTVAFADASTGTVTSWQWDFQNDGVVDSTAENPQFTYETAGSHTVKLTVADALGNSSTKTRTDYINVGTLAADFTATPTSGSAPLVVNFDNASTGNPTGWQWDFQNDGVVDSTAENPQFTYSAEGSYTVKLTVTDEQGKSSTKTRADYVAVSPPLPQVTFAPAADAYVRSLSPTNNYGKAVSLRVKDGGATGEHYRSYLKFDVAGLSDPVTSATLRLYVTDPAAGGGNVFTADNAWTETGLTWNTQPTSGTSALAGLGSVAVDTWVEVALPAETFAAGTGTYSLLVKSPGQTGGTAWYSSREGANAPQLVLSTASTGPTADFTGSPTSGAPPLTVQFTDTSSGGPTSWAWDFGDGTTSTEQNPTHAYDAEGTYTVALTVTDADGKTSTKTRTDYIEVVAPHAGFTATPTSGPAPLNVSFTDTSTGAPTSWAWDFENDGVVDSTAQNPQFTYASPGTYTVKLTISNAAGTSDTMTRTDYITAQALTADFAGTPTSGTAPLAVSFTDNSIGTPTTWAWDFGDGTTSSEQNPSHTYASAGTYTVMLTVTDASGATSTKTKTDYITAASDGLFTPSGDSYVNSSYPDKNYGGASSVRVKNGDSSLPHYRSFFQFSVSGLSAPVTSAKLRLYVSDGASDGGSVYVVENGWTETGITFNNAPLITGEPLANLGKVVAGTWVEVQLPASALASGNATYSFAVRSDNPSGGTSFYHSRQGTNAPQLVVSTG